MIAIAERHLRDVSAQIQTLEKFKQELTTAVRLWKKAGKQTVAAGAICALIERTMEERGALVKGNKNGKQ